MLVNDYLKNLKSIPPLYDFTEPELDKFRLLCNFTETERQYFELKCRQKTNIQISMAMNVSEAQVSKLAKKVRTKIIRILPFV